VSEIVQIVGKSPEGADWHVIGVRIHGGYMHCRADVDSGGSWVHTPEIRKRPVRPFLTEFAGSTAGVQKWLGKTEQPG
jgi:hypothetical protein